MKKDRNVGKRRNVSQVTTLSHPQERTKLRIPELRRNDMLFTVLAMMIAALFLFCLLEDFFDDVQSEVRVSLNDSKGINSVDAPVGPPIDDPERYFWKPREFFLERCDDVRFIKISKRELARVTGEIGELDRRKKSLEYRLRMIPLFRSSSQDLNERISELNKQKASIELSIKRTRSRLRTVGKGKSPSSTTCELRTTDRSLRSRPISGD